MVIQVLNLAECLNKLGAIGKIDMYEPIKDATLLVQATAKDIAPVDTGRLRDSIRAKVGKRNGEVIGSVGTNVEYAPYQEFGTTRMLPQPFLRPALLYKKREIEKILSNYVKDKLSKKGK